MAKRQTQPDGTLTRKQILLSRREKEQLRVVYWGLGLVAALIAVVLAIGAVQTYIIEPNSPIAVVDGVELSSGAYRTRDRYERFILNLQYQQILSQQAALTQSGDEQLSQFLLGQYQQLANQILQQLSSVDRQTLDTMIDDVLIEVEATKRDISVSEADVTEFINRFLAGRQGGLTAAAASETATARVEASATAAQWTPTPTFTPSPTLTSTEEITPTAVPAETPTPAPTPTLNVIDESTLSTEYDSWVKTLAEIPDVAEAEYRQIARTLVFRNKLLDDIGAEVLTSAEQSHARHILVETAEEAQAVVERLKAGEDFAELAGELSTDPGSSATGGDLGFVSRGAFVGPVDEAVFNLPLGQISEPIESEFGWHVIEVLEREVRELSPTEYRRSQQLAFEQWLTDARAAAEIEDFWTPDKAPPGSPIQIQPQFPDGAPNES